MPIVLGDPNQGGFHIDLAGLYRQPNRPPIVNLNPDRGGGGGAGSFGSVAPQMLQYQTEAAFNRDQQHAQLQAWLFQQDMTAREQMDLQRRQNALSFIQNDPNLTDDQRHDASMQLMTGINLGQQRLQASQQRHQEAIARVEMDQAARQEAIANMNGQQYAQALRDQAVELAPGLWVARDPATGRAVHMTAPRDQSGQQQEREDRARESHEDRWHQERRAADQQARRELTVAGQTEPPAESAITDRANSIMRRHNFADNLPQHMQAWDREHRTKRGGVVQEALPGQTEEVPEEAGQLDTSRQEARAQGNNQLDILGRLVARDAPERARELQPIVDEVRTLYNNTGGLRRASDVQRARFQELRRRLEAALPRTAPDFQPPLARPNRPLFGYGGAGDLSIQQAAGGQ